MQYRLRSLLIWLGFGPPILALLWLCYITGLARELAEMTFAIVSHGLIGILVLVTAGYALSWTWYGIAWAIYGIRHVAWRFQNRE